MSLNSNNRVFADIMKRINGERSVAGMSQEMRDLRYDLERAEGEEFALNQAGSRYGGILGAATTVVSLVTADSPGFSINVNGAGAEIVLWDDARSMSSSDELVDSVNKQISAFAGANAEARMGFTNHNGQLQYYLYVPLHAAYTIVVVDIGTATVCAKLKLTGGVGETVVTYGATVGETLSFLSMTDTPASMTANQALRMNAGGTALEAVPGTFLGALTDTPAVGAYVADSILTVNHAGDAIEQSAVAASQLLRMNAGGTALEAVDGTFLGLLTDTPAVYIADRALVVNAAGDAVEHSPVTGTILTQLGASGQFDLGMVPGSDLVSNGAIVSGQTTTIETTTYEWDGGNPQDPVSGASTEDDLNALAIMINTQGAENVVAGTAMAVGGQWRLPIQEADVRGGTPVAPKVGENVALGGTNANMEWTFVNTNLTGKAPARQMVTTSYLATTNNIASGVFLDVGFVPTAISVVLTSATGVTKPHTFTVTVVGNVIYILMTGAGAADTDIVHVTASA